VVAAEAHPAQPAPARVCILLVCCKLLMLASDSSLKMNSVVLQRKRCPVLRLKPDRRSKRLIKFCFLRPYVHDHHPFESNPPLEFIPLHCFRKMQFTKRKWSGASGKMFRIKQHPLIMSRGNV
jgi:hypothetical protein